jgi:uncharacterized protein (DUF1330 family)
MPAYLISSYTVTGNEDELALYREAGLPVLQRFGAEVLVAEENAHAREGTPGQHTVVVKFPSREAADGFYDSEEYQRVLHYRTDNADGWLVICDELAPPAYRAAAGQ